MPDRTQAPSGLARRHQRMSDEETERRMLDAATAMVNEAGLTVSLEHISYEDVIREARVSRSTVYRRWPYKDLFFSDLLKELAKAATPAAVASEETSAPLIRRIVLDRRDWLATPEQRRNLLLELIRQGSAHEFATLHGSVEWRTYLALHATFLSVAGEELRDELREVLARSERDFIERIASAWERTCALFGYRLRPGLGTSFETLATLASADLRGHVLMALASPELVVRQLRGSPFGTLEEAEWSLPAFALASVAIECLEPDPAVVWNDERVEYVLGAVEALAPEPLAVG